MQTINKYNYKILIVKNKNLNDKSAIRSVLLLKEQIFTRLSTGTSGVFNNSF